MAMAPCPTAGMKCSGSKYSEMASPLSQPLQSRRGQDHSVHSAFVRDLQQAGVHVAADGFDPQVRPRGLEQCPPAHTAGAHSRATRESSQSGVMTVYQYVSRIAPSQDGRQMESLRQFRGHVFQRVRRHVDVAVFELLFKLFHVNADAKLCNRGGAISVAARPDDNRLKRSPGISVFEGGNRQRGLGEREPAAASTYAYWPC